jgi:PAS domain S-box-containing protein
MTGYSAKELSEIPFKNIIHPDDREMVLERRRKRLLGEKPPSTYSFRMINKSGGELLVQINTVLITWEGNPATINFIRDITEQKRLEAQLQQAQKMESIGTLAGGIAHDFNNLLMGIQGRTSLMLMDSDSSHSRFGHLKGIEDYVKSAVDLTRQLLGFARGGKYEIKPTDLNEFIKKQNRMFGRTTKEINIRGKYEKNLWTTEIDKGQIEQVLLNLYVNSWQAMPGGGSLYIQTENIVIDEFFIRPYHVEPGKYVKISVTDTGVGMDKATQQRIFDPFFTTKEMGRGTGLGLASAYGIIKNHNGFIDVYSERGEGTTFNIYLPASEKEAVNEEEVNEELFRGIETLLLVDDEDMIVDVGCGIIEKLGYKSLTAKSGEEAIGIYKKNHDKIDMVIIDMIMPDMDGGETYDKLKEINPDVKVLLSSGYSINGQATEILERGCNGFIQKPFNMADLSKKIREILDKD